MKEPSKEDQSQPIEGDVDVIDLEEFAKTKGGKPPKAKRYRIRIDKVKYETTNPEPTGREILELAGKVPVEHWMLNKKVRGGGFEPVGLDEKVDLTAPGVERFTTLPKDQTEGRPSPRIQVDLPEEDVEALNAAGFLWETIKDPSGSWLLIHGFALPSCFACAETAVAVSIPSGYPTTALDMAYFHPAVARVDGTRIPNTEATVQIDGKSWQRWSRHYTSANPWKPGEYNTITHLHLVRHWIDKEAAK
jgi:hypothetical protein